MCVSWRTSLPACFSAARLWGPWYPGGHLELLIDKGAAKLRKPRSVPTRPAPSPGTCCPAVTTPALRQATRFRRGDGGRGTASRTLHHLPASMWISLVPAEQDTFPRVSLSALSLARGLRRPVGGLGVSAGPSVGSCTLSAPCDASSAVIHLSLSPPSGHGHSLGS